jgi:hypothetical protein
MSDQKKIKVKRSFLKKRKVKVILIIIALLIAIRLILPYVILHFANKKLATMNGYYGHVKDIDLAIYRGAYSIKNVFLHKKDSITNLETDFFDSEVIDLSVQWNALLSGRIVGEVVFENPRLIFTKDKVEPAQIQKDTTDFRELLDDFMPLQINRFEVLKGVIQYNDQGSNPPVNIQMDNVKILAENLKTVKDTALLPARVTASANVYGGTLEFNLKLDPLAKDPTFDMNAELKNTDLPQLNSFFKAYGKFDVNKGTFGLYTEVAAKDKKFIGYVKPLLKDLDIVGPEDKQDKFLQKFWEGIVGTAGVVFKNQKKDQVATKIPLEGTFQNTDANLWYAIVDILRNAFIEALKPSIDNEINIGSVNEVQEEKKKGFFEKIFNGDKKDKKKKKTEKENPK